MEENKELTVLEGTVDSVVFRNEENGYTVLRLTVGEGEPVTVVGCMPGAAPGEGLSVQGSWGRHASYGEQFKAEIVERRDKRDDRKKDHRGKAKDKKKKSSDTSRFYE